MMIRRLLSVIGCLLLLFNGPSQAQATIDLYQAQVPVKNRSETAQNEGFKKGLTQVLIKLSGDRQAPLQAAIQSQLTRPDRFVIEYRYLTETNDSKPVLSMYFDQGGVDDLLVRLRLPKWSSTRPALLGWVLIDTPEGQNVLSEETPSPELDLLKNQAQQRGIPLLWPLLDVEDLTTFKATEVITGAPEPALQVAERYGVKTLLVGWVLKTSSGWQSQWQLYINQEATTFDYYHQQLPAVLVEGFNLAVDKIAKHFLKVLPVTPLPSPAPPVESTKETEKAPVKPNSEPKATSTETETIEIETTDDTDTAAPDESTPPETEAPAKSTTPETKETPKETKTTETGTTDDTDTIDKTGATETDTVDKTDTTETDTVDKTDTTETETDTATEAKTVEFEILVTNVPTLQDYAKVSEYLENLDVIDELQVLRIQPGEVKFRVTVAGGKAALLQAISLGSLLTPQSKDKEETVYRLLR